MNPLLKEGGNARRALTPGRLTTRAVYFSEKYRDTIRTGFSQSPACSTFSRYTATCDVRWLCVLLRSISSTCHPAHPQVAWMTSPPTSTRAQPASDHPFQSRKPYTPWRLEHNSDTWSKILCSSAAAAEAFHRRR